jgi:ferric-dicitrate binding protein FerR (iron transport regulator)
MAKKDPGTNSLQSAYRIGYLLAGYIKKSLTDEEISELDVWRQQREANEKLFQEYTNPDKVHQFLDEYGAADTETYLQKSKTRIQQIEQFSRRRTWRNLAAAVIGLSVTGSLIFIMTRKTTDKADQSMAAKTEQHLPPSATLTINANAAIDIDATGFDSLFANGNRLIAKDRELSYSISSNTNEEHLLSVPAKGFFRVVLPDGTKVWVNANSSLRYSTTFSKSERRVQLKGEAYFEVAHNKEKPFRVECAGGEIEALGTAFNVKAYESERSFTTTLTEGKVRIRSGSQHVILQPGERVVMQENHLVKGVANTDEVLGWSKNEFVFDNSTLTDVMQELSLWYGVEVEYKTTTRPKFRFSISRDTSLSQILSLLEKTNEVHFQVNEKKITVTN